MTQKKSEVKKCDDLTAYCMKMALINELLRLNKITEKEYSLIKAKLKVEHKIV